jgi:hypothetical protein
MDYFMHVCFACFAKKSVEKSCKPLLKYNSLPITLPDVTLTLRSLLSDHVTLFPTAFLVNS